MELVLEKTKTKLNAINLKKHINSYSIMNVGVLVGLVIDMHLYFPNHEHQITSIGLVLGLVCYFYGNHLRKKEKKDKK